MKTLTQKYTFDSKALLKFAIDVAKRGTEEIIKSNNHEILKYKSYELNFTTYADQRSESIVKEMILAARPYDGLLGEEGSYNLSRSGLRWVIDPLDGTVNYYYGIPHWAISISCEKQEKDIWHRKIAVVYDVLKNELFTAIHNRGAFLNGIPIVVSKQAKLSNALIATEFSYRREARILQATLFANLLPQVRDMRNTGSSALDLCWLAAGRFDGFYENELFPWDWSAASLIVEEAGGIVSNFGTGVIAGTPEIHKNLISLLCSECT